MKHTWEPYGTVSQEGQFERLRIPVGKTYRPICIVRIVPWPNDAGGPWAGRYTWVMGTYEGHEETLEEARRKAEIAAAAWPETVF